MAKLKTYSAEIDGLHEWIVAAPNQRAALDALGVNQNLFAQGEAAVVTDPDLVKAATARPGLPLRRTKGSKAAFEAAAATADWTPALADAKANSPKRPPVSRRALDEAQAALAEFDSEAGAEIQVLQTERDKLAKRLDQARAAIDQRRGELQKAVDKAGRDYRDKGGVS